LTVTGAQDAIESALKESKRLRKALLKDSGKQVRSDDEKQVAKATAQSWFHSHRAIITAILDDDSVKAIDEQFKLLIASTNRATSRTKYIAALKQIERLLGQLQAERVVELASHTATATTTTTDAAPNFSTLGSDAKMQIILVSRWQECVKCVDVGASLAATVMMGGLLEGLLLAKINQLSDKSAVFKAASAPKDRAGNALKLNEWGLKNYMDVAHELNWISKTAKDIGEVVRDYRNYIHPQKEYSHGISISSDDARMLWEVAKTVTVQILKP
jgi:hypothetical protein